jgi:hypothetical protein
MSALDSAVREWAADLLGSRVKVSPLSGGANNYLFSCRSPEGELVIKRYREQNFGAEISRRQAEVTFLKHASQSAPEFVPQLLAEHDSYEMIALSRINGDAYLTRANIADSDIQAAIRFYQQVNDDKELISRYPIAAREGYLSISEHLAHIDQRIAALSVAHVPTEITCIARAAIDAVKRQFDQAKEVSFRSIARSEVSDRLPLENVQLSPGDFGFHNALRSGGTPVFFDFEYAGSDDPAKTIADFFLQPKVPVDSALFEQVAEAMAYSLPAVTIKTRGRILGRLLSVKWLAIILAPFDQSRYPSFSARYGTKASTEMLRRLSFVSCQTLFE